MYNKKLILKLKQTIILFCLKLFFKLISIHLNIIISLKYLFNYSVNFIFLKDRFISLSPSSFKYLFNSLKFVTCCSASFL